jgi:hypothetical protein
MTKDPIIHIQIRAATLEDLKEFTDETQPDLGCRATARKMADGYVVDAYIPELALETARAARSVGKVSIRVIENASEVGRQRQQEAESMGSESNTATLNEYLFNNQYVIC